MQYHRALSSIRKWELSLGSPPACPSLAEMCPRVLLTISPVHSLWGIASCIAQKFKQSFTLSLFHSWSTTSTKYRVRGAFPLPFAFTALCALWLQTGRSTSGEFLTVFFQWTFSAVVLFFSVIRINYCCFPTAAWKRGKLKVSVSGDWKQNEKRWKRGQNWFQRPTDVEWIVVLLAKEVSVSSACPPPPEINNTSSRQSPELHSVHTAWR